MKIKKTDLIRTIISLAFFAGIVVFGSCTSPNSTGKLTANRPPQTTLANIPPADTFHTFNNAIITLNWSGKDPDGFITAFRFRWITYQQNPFHVDSTQWRTVLNTTFLGNSKFAVEIKQKESVHNLRNIPNAFHYLSTQNDTTAFGKIDRGEIFILDGDTLFRANTKELTNPNKGTFIFDSGADSNVQVFEVDAIDNEGLLDPSPATIRFGTPRIYPPDTQISTAGITTTVIRDSSTSPPVVHTTHRDPFVHPMRPDVTETYAGLTYTFFASDSSSIEQEYQWKVDSSGAWSDFSINDNATFTAAMCDSSNNGWFDTTKIHFFAVRARSQYLLVDPTPDTVFFRMHVPEFIFGTSLHPYLLLDNTDSLGNLNDNVTVRESPTPNQRMFFFRSVLDNIPGVAGMYDTFRVSPKRKFPDLNTLSKYSAIVLTDEKKVRGSIAQLGQRLYIGTQNVHDLVTYLNLGGRLIISSWDLYSRIKTDADPFLRQPLKDTLFTNYLHANTLQLFQAPVPCLTHDFLNAAPNTWLNYPGFSLDTTKLKDSVNAMDSITAVNVSGLSTPIYFFNSKTHDPDYDNIPIGVQYIGPTYKTVYFGFPLYYVPFSDAVLMLKNAFHNIRNSSENF